MGRRLDEFKLGHDGQIPTDEHGNPYIGPRFGTKQESDLMTENIANRGNRNVWRMEVNPGIEARHLPGSGRMSFYKGGELVAHFGITKDAVSPEGLESLARGIVKSNEFGHFDSEEGK